MEKVFEAMLPLAQVDVVHVQLQPGSSHTTELWFIPWLQVAAERLGYRLQQKDYGDVKSKIWYRIDYQVLLERKAE